MANTSSAKKAIRVQNRKRIINLEKINAFKAAKKAVMDLLAQGKVDEAERKLPEAYKKIDKAAKKNTIHKNKAARIKSRLTRDVNLAKASK